MPQKMPIHGIRMHKGVIGQRQRLQAGSNIKSVQIIVPPMLRDATNGNTAIEPSSMANGSTMKKLGGVCSLGASLNVSGSPGAAGVFARPPGMPSYGIG